MEETKLQFLHLWDTFLHQHNIHPDFYILNSQTNTQKQKLLRGTKLHLSFMDRFLHIKSSNKYPKTKTTKRGNEPKKRKKKELRPLNLSLI